MRPLKFSLQQCSVWLSVNAACHRSALRLTQMMAANCKKGQIKEEENFELSLLRKQRKTFSNSDAQTWLRSNAVSVSETKRSCGRQTTLRKDRIVSGVRNTSSKLQKLFGATCVAQRRLHPFQHCMNEDMSACVWWALQSGFVSQDGVRPPANQSIEWHLPLTERACSLLQTEPLFSRLIWSSPTMIFRVGRPDRRPRKILSTLASSSSLS